MENNSQLLLEEYMSIGSKLAKKWEFLVEDIKDEYVRNTTSILLENTLRKIQEDANLNGVLQEGFESTDVMGINRILLPVIRRVYPHLMANEFVTVQPMLTPTAQIFYLRYRYGASANSLTGQASINRKGTTKAGDEFLRVPAFGDFGLNPYYSSQIIQNEAFISEDGNEVAGDDLSGTYTKILDWYPVLNGSIVVKLMTYEDKIVKYKAPGGIDAERIERTYKDVIGKVIFGSSYSEDTNNATKVEGDGFSLTLSDHNYNATTREVSVAVSYDSPNNPVALVCDWEYSLENQNLIPEMKINIETDYVTAKERKLKTEFTQEAMQDLKALHNIDAEAEITAVISSMLIAEIDREILADLINGAAIRVTHDYTADSQNQTARNYLDRNQALAAKVIDVAAQIYAYGKLGSGNWCVTHPRIAAKLESVRGYESANEGKYEEFNMGITLAGTLQGKQLKVYVDPYFPPDKILVGYKGNSFLATSYVYAPYQPLYTTPLIYDPVTLKPIRGFLTRYGKKLVVGGEYLLGVITVKNLE